MATFMISNSLKCLRTVCVTHSVLRFTFDNTYNLLFKNGLVTRRIFIHNTKNSATTIASAVNKTSSKETKVEEIVLITEDNSIQTTNLENAKKIAKRHSSKLEKVDKPDIKTDKAVYKLVSLSNVFDDSGTDERQDTSDKTVLKSQKLITLSTKIAQHDLSIKIKNIQKLVRKRHVVKVIVTAEGPSMEPVIQSIEKSLKSDGEIKDKRVKGNATMFKIVPHSSTSAEIKRDSSK